MNTCPNCGLVRGMHGSILPGCMCPWTPQASVVFTPKELDELLNKVRADERDRAMRENAYVQAEREACAKVCESYLSESSHSWGGTTMAAAIRARGNT